KRFAERLHEISPRDLFRNYFTLFVDKKLPTFLTVPLVVLHHFLQNYLKELPAAGHQWQPKNLLPEIVALAG
ncbi:MAG: hypothetical protein DMG88_02870, partial [Acidobacteria bacterium]